MLRAPWACSSSIISASRAVVTGRPKPSLEISWFWQNTQRSGQPEKKMAPEPASPEIGGSSHRCSALLATRSSALIPQRPGLPSRRRAPQRRGQSAHDP